MNSISQRVRVVSALGAQWRQTSVLLPAGQLTRSSPMEKKSWRLQSDSGERGAECERGSKCGGRSEEWEVALKSDRFISIYAFD